MLTAQATLSQEITPAILNSTGGSATSNITLEWSVGEMTTVNSANSGNMWLNAGVLQGQLRTGHVLRTNMRQKPTITPNPLVNHGYLQYQEASRGTITCDITDASGKMLRRLTFVHQGGTNSYRLNTQDIPPGALYLIIRFTPSISSVSANTDLIKIVRQ